jgi:aspartyl-tRNA(Asn)/glutamyl-tRNA(Gln) amidotransferase subunit A
VSVKDVVETRDAPTTWGAQALAGHRSGRDATIVTRLRRAGAILVGKANVDMYPYDGSPEHRRLIGASRNPWDLARTAGRSSGGSAAAVAARMDFGSIGSDTTGSIRGPAAWCGVVGVKPTFGLVSTHGVFRYSRSFDACGPIARTTHDCALLLEAIAGYDPECPASVDRPVPDYTRSIGRDLRGVRVGTPRAAEWRDNDPEVTGLVDEAAVVLGALGGEVRDIDPPLQEGLWANVISILETAEMVEAGVTVDGFPDAFAGYLWKRNAGARQRVLAQGAQIMIAVRRRYEEVFRLVDVIVTPTVAATASLFTDTSSPWQRPHEPFVEVLPRYTRPASLIGYPAISVPCGFTSAGLPAGMQIIGRPFEEETLFRVAGAYERATNWHRHAPALVPASTADFR